MFNMSSICHHYLAWMIWPCSLWLCCPSCTWSKQHVRFLDIVSNRNAGSSSHRPIATKKSLQPGIYFAEDDRLQDSARRIGILKARKNI